jgi:hypothetical protein
VGDIPGAPPRVDEIRFDPADHAYGPVGGTDGFAPSDRRPLQPLVPARQGKPIHQGQRGPLPTGDA